MHVALMVNEETPPFSPPRAALVRLAVLLALASSGEGCASLRSGRPPKAPPTATAQSTAEAAPPGPAQPPAEVRVGSVRMIGRGGKFVLVETLGGGPLTLLDGQALHCRPGLEPGAPASAHLRLSRERRHQFASADVVDGQPRLGDAVFIGGPAAPGGSLPPSPPGGRP